MDYLLEVRDLHKSFGALKALDGVDFTLAPGEVAGVIGPNGSGKTTLFNLICGELKAERGRVFWQGRDITGLPSFRICRLGLVKTDQVDHTFAEMSVKENVMLGAMFGAGKSQRQALRQAAEILELVGLSELAAEPAASLNVPRRKRLGLARALATAPAAILLDENLAGLTPAEVSEALVMLKELNRQGVALVMVEHVMQAILGICQRVVVLDFGQKIAEGTPTQVVCEPMVLEAYLGERYA